MFGEDDPVPPPRPQFFSSDFGNSHDLAGLGLEARPPSGYVATATSLSLQRFLSDQLSQCLPDRSIFAKFPGLVEPWLLVINLKLVLDPS